MLATIDRIVSTPRGSWRWQNAYRIASYAPHRTKDGRWIWRSLGRGRAKLSMPQIRRRAYWARLDIGSLHNRPISPDDLRWLALA